MGAAGGRVAAFMAAVFMAGGVSTAFLPLWLAEGGLQASDIGAVLGLATLARLLSMPVWGWLADRAGRPHAAMAAASLLATAASLAYLPAAGFAPLLIVTLWLAATSSALMPLADTLAIALMREGRIDYGRVRAVGSAAFMAATSGAGWLAASFGARVVPMLLGFGFAAATALAVMLPRVRGATRRPGTGGAGLLRNRGFLLLVAAAGLIQGAHAAYYGLATLHWRDHGIGDGMIGLLWSEGVLAEIAVFVWARPVGRALSPSAMLTLAGAAGLVRWGLTAVTTAVPALLALQVLHGATYGLTHLGCMLLLARLVPVERAGSAQTLLATFGSAVPTGLMIWLSGLLYDGGGRVFLPMAVMAGCGGLLAIRLARARA